MPPEEPIENIVAIIRGRHRERCFAMEQRKRAHLALGAFLRTMHGWSPDKPEPERKKIRAAVAALIKQGGGPEWGHLVLASEAATAEFVKIEEEALDEMERLAGSLPVWASFGKATRGFGPASLAVIVGEAGDLSNYPTKDKLWKRLGLAVLDGVRQGGLSSKGSTKEDWIRHGYNPRRRAHIWVIGDALIKAQVRQVKDDDGEDTGDRIALGEYGQVYLDRKRLELERDAAIAPIKAHLRAQRYMEKRLLKHLWQSWRAASGALSEKTIECVPLAEPLRL